MQALRHASRRALHASVVMQETCAASVKGYSSEAASPVTTRKSREERFELAQQFVAKFKAANNGQLPGITLLRKEVGGKYETLKEVLQELSKDQGEPDTLKQTVELKDADGKTQEFAAAVKDGDKKKSTVKEDDSKKDKKETPQVSKGSKAVKSVDQAYSKTTFKDIVQTIQSAMPVKDASKPVTDTLLISNEDDDDDSDVAAPEYHHTPLIRVDHHKMEKGLKAEKGKEKVLGNGLVAHLKKDFTKKQIDNQAIKSKHADVKQLEEQDDGKRIELPPIKGRDAVSAVVKTIMDNTAAKHPLTDGSVSKPYGLGPLTTVARIINLPLNITSSKLKAICESVAKVQEVNLRRGRIADVQFNVDIQEMNNVLNRLRAVTIGSSVLRVFPAHKFSCGNNAANSQFKPQDVNHYKQVRNVLIYSLEQRFRYLCWQVQDYRELQEMKLAK